MNALKAVFAVRHVFLPVVHAETPEQAVRNAVIADDNGADGIFLINHSISHEALFACFEKVHICRPKLWTGLNCLDLGAQAVAFIPIHASGLWTDHAGVDDGPGPFPYASAFVRRKGIRKWNGVYFGGVAFKYQEEVGNPARAAVNAIYYDVDVITTSGAATGKAPAVEKIREMKEAIGDHALAIASGITPDNVAQYMPFADAFLVATSISNSHTELNPLLVRAFAKAIGK